MVSTNKDLTKLETELKRLKQLDKQNREARSNLMAEAKLSKEQVAKSTLALKEKGIEFTSIEDLRTEKAARMARAEEILARANKALADSEIRVVEKDTVVTEID